MTSQVSRGFEVVYFPMVSYSFKKASVLQYQVNNFFWGGGGGGGEVLSLVLTPLTLSLSSMTPSSICSTCWRNSFLFVSVLMALKEETSTTILTQAYE